LKSTSWCVEAKETMNKRLPLLFSLLALILLAASIAYWVLQLYKPEQRPLAAAPATAQAEPSPDAAATLFGGQPSVAAVSNFQLTGVVSAGPNSAVIIVADGAPPVAVRIGREIAPGVVVQEVHAKYVMLSDGGVLKRVELATDTRPAGGASAPPPAPVPVAAAPAPGVEPQTSPGVVSAPPGMQPAPTPETYSRGAAPGQGPAQSVPEPPMDPGATDGPPADPNAAAPPPNQVQMPPPTRSVNSPVGQNSTTQ
jgi:general secretion pathway protein C